MRNVVYAYGCRILMSKTATFSEAIQSATGWFENALSVHTDLIYRQASLLAVQVLVVMVGL